MTRQSDHLTMPRTIAAVSLLVDDYDQAIRFYTQALRFVLLEDTLLAPGKRWVRVAPAGGGTALLLARAAAPEQRALVGGQGAGRVWLFLQTDDFDGELAHLRAHGVRLAEEPRREAYGRVVVFLDLYGNRWDLIEPAGAQT
jgi:catechol 2,3-dioxygenase-like lactoylglutathione lyase family enzyme